MQKKAIINVGQRIAQLKVIPKEKLPATLAQEIVLPNIKQVRLNYRLMCKNIGLSLQFARKYGPALRYYNPGLTVSKVQQNDGPIAMQILVFPKGQQQEAHRLIPNEYKSVEEILAAIRAIDQKTQ